ncbi:MAG: hypothetical protein AAFY56_17325 [Pseudomonadota bacterium]
MRFRTIQQHSKRFRPITASRRKVLSWAIGSFTASHFLIGSALATSSSIRPLDARVIQSGHSLTDTIVPVLKAMVSASGGMDAFGQNIERSTIPGSPMDWRWNNRNEYMPDARERIAEYDILVITERAPLSGTVPWHASDEWALRWFTHAWENGRGGEGAESFLYATWVNIDSGPSFENPYNDPEGHIPFRERLPLEMARWEAILAHVNSNRPADAPPMRLIPGPLVMAAAFDAIAEGTAPNLDDISDLFIDNIHLNETGSYLIALTHFAVIYQRDPKNIPGRIGMRRHPDPNTAAWMRDLVSEVLRNYGSDSHKAEQVE